MYGFRPEREIYVVFHDETQYFFSPVMRKGFKHVFCIERQGLGWVCFDPSRSDMIATILPASYHIDIMPRFCEDNPTSTILKLIVNPNDRSNYPRPGILSCVGAVQYFLGVYWPCVWTPYQLYRKLSNINDDHIKVTDYVR